MFTRSLAAAACAVTLAASTLSAQHDMSMHDMAGPLPAFPGQAAFATIAEVVAILKADSSTDWSKVDLDALREHLIDMDEVVMHASVAKKNVPGGIEARVTGTGRTVQAIRRMLTTHAAMLDQDAAYHAVATEIPNGIRFTVTAKDAGDAARVATIRGLGFAGLLTEGNHHPRHHLAIARGEAHAHDR
ncbi:MAG: hypothetical protein ACREPM_08085 [Gemmatimonadaceae bacterium]